MTRSVGYDYPEGCFGLCLEPSQQLLVWSGLLFLTSVAAFIWRFWQNFPTASEVKDRFAARRGTMVCCSQGEYEVEQLLEDGRCRSFELDPLHATYAISDKMAQLCIERGTKHGLEAAGLAVLLAYTQRRDYNSPSVGVFVGAGFKTVDVALADDAMSFTSLLEAVDAALSALRGTRSDHFMHSEDDSSPPEVTFSWDGNVSGPVQWAFKRRSDYCIEVKGNSPEQESSYKMLFEACASDPDGDVWQMPLYTTEILMKAKSFGEALMSFRQYRDPANGRLIPIPKLLWEAFKNGANYKAEAVGGKEFSFSYLQLWTASAAVAAAVQEKMQGKDDKKVVLFMGRGKMIAPSFIGILQAGCTVVPIDIHWPGDRAKGVAIDSGAQLVVMDEASAKIWNANESSCPTILVDDELLDKANRNQAADLINDPVMSLDPDTDAIVLFTSGSTGKPKGIVLSHGYLTALVCGVGDTKEMTSTTRTLCFHSPTWMPFLDYLLAPLLKGGCCLLYPEGATHAVRPNDLNAFAQEHGATLIGLVPAVLDIFLDTRLPASLTTIGVGGAAVTAELCHRVAEACQGRGFLLTTGYSGTEQGDVTNIRMRCSRDVMDAAQGRTVMLAGRPHAGQSHAIVDRRTGLVGPGATGEIMVTGPGLASCYLGLPQQTSDYFIDCKPLGGKRAARTGDLGRWTEDGQLELVGRLGSMVKVRGARIDLGEVEVAIAAHPDIKACVVVVHDDKLVAYVQPAVPADARDFCKTRLVAYMVPHIFEGLEEIPRLANGKVNKKALKPPTPSEDGLETVMELDSLGQMRKFSRKDAAEDLVLDNVRAILIGLVIMSHAIPLSKAGNLDMLHGRNWKSLGTYWTTWQFEIFFLLRSGGWSALAFLSGYDDTRAEHKGYGLGYREVLFVAIWIGSKFNWTMWYLPAFVYMRISFVFWSKIGLEYANIIVTAFFFILAPAFMDLYIGWKPVPDFPGQETVCTCFCPFQAWPHAQLWSKYLIGYWQCGVENSFVGHGLIFIPSYLIGLYSGKHIFPWLCKLSNSPKWWMRGLVAASMLAVYFALLTHKKDYERGYDDRCSAFWEDSSFVTDQVLKNIRYWIFNLSMSLLWVVVIVAVVPFHLKYLAKVCFPALLFSPFSECLLDLPAQALAIRDLLPLHTSPFAELAWVVTVSFMYELISGAILSTALTHTLRPLIAVYTHLSSVNQLQDSPQQ